MANQTHDEITEVQPSGLSKSVLDRKLQALLDSAQEITRKLAAHPTDGACSKTLVDGTIMRLEQLVVTLSKGRYTTSLDSALLDRASVELWNFSTVMIRQDERDITDKVLICAVRTAACLLIDCVEKLSSESTDGLRTFKCYIKSLKMCLDNDADESLMKILTRIPKVYETVSQSEFAKNLIQWNAISAEYFVLRVYAAWKSDNADLMEIWYKKFASLVSSAQLRLQDQKVEYIMEILFNIGTDHLEKKEFENAAQWLDRATDMFKSLNIAGEDEIRDGMAELQFNVMRNLVKALYNTDKPENIERAKAVLQSMDEDYPSTIWTLVLRYDILAKENGSADALSDVIMQMIFCGNLNDNSFRIIMSKADSLAEESSHNACKVFDYLLTKKLDYRDQTEWFQRVFISRLALAARFAQSSSADALGPLRKLFGELERLLSTDLSKNAIYSSQSILWSVATAYFAREDYMTALEWFSLSIDSVLRGSDDSNRTKIQRKIMLCQYYLQEYSQITSVYRSMPRSGQDSSMTQYILFKSALASQDTQSALECLDRMFTASAEDAKILCACAMEAQQKNIKPVTLRAMDLILQKLLAWTGPTAGYKISESVNDIYVPALLRCIIRMHTLTLAESGESVEQIDRLCAYFERAYSLTKPQSRLANSQSKKFDKNEYEWFARNAYNAALKGCKSWPCEATIRLADLSLKFLEAYEDVVTAKDSLQTSEGEMKILELILWQRKLHIAEQRELYELCRKNVRLFRQARMEYTDFTSKIESNDADATNRAARESDLCAKMTSMMSFDFEATANLENWHELVNITLDLVQLQPELRIYESFVDILLSSLSCPVEESLRVLQLILRATLTDDATDIPKLSRWLRILVSVSLPRYPEMAEDILAKVRLQLTESYKLRYPSEEVHWLATTAWNHGVDLYSKSDMEACKSWLGIAIQLAGHVNPVIASQMLTNYNFICSAEELV
ncbi:meiosis protein SPO22/ZIP4 like-domain-containing protein [Limtongia smithiae]|uniref:meiosis protein SPO22/ZIP4 like-domain-containing protein n=1 Tax=Limtongia smithiae TaxID=1125753 RepID=UPI0034CD2AC3